MSSDITISSSSRGTLLSESVIFAKEKAEFSKTISVGTSVETFHPELVSVATSIGSLPSDNTNVTTTSVETRPNQHVRFKLSEEKLCSGHVSSSISTVCSEYLPCRNAADSQSLADNNIEGLPIDKVTPASFNIKNANHIKWALGILAAGADIIETDRDPPSTVNEELLTILQTSPVTRDSEDNKYKSSLVNLNGVQTRLFQARKSCISLSNPDLVKAQGLQRKRCASTRAVSPSFTDYYHQRSGQENAQRLKQKKVRNRSQSESPSRNKRCVTFPEPTRSPSPFPKRKKQGERGRSGTSEPNLLPVLKSCLKSPRSTKTETKLSVNQNKNRSVSPVKANYSPFESPKSPFDKNEKLACYGHTTTSRPVSPIMKQNTQHMLLGTPLYSNSPEARSDTSCTIDQNKCLCIPPFKGSKSLSPCPRMEQKRIEPPLRENNSPTPSRYKSCSPSFRTDQRRNEYHSRVNKSPSPCPRNHINQSECSTKKQKSPSLCSRIESHPSNTLDIKRQNMVNSPNLNLEPIENLATADLTCSNASNVKQETKSKTKYKRNRSVSPRKSKLVSLPHTEPIQSRWKQKRLSRAVIEPIPLPCSSPSVNHLDHALETKSETFDLCNSNDLWQFGILKGTPKPRKDRTAKVPLKRKECSQASDTASQKLIRQRTTGSPYWSRQTQEVDLEGIMEHVFGMSESYRTSELVLDPDLLDQATFDITTFMDPSDGEGEFPNRVDVFQQQSYRPGLDEKLHHKFNGPGGNGFDMERVRRRVSKKIWPPPGKL